MKPAIFRIVPRLESGVDPVLFLPDLPTNDPCIVVCYSRIGEHSVASFEYYRRKTRPDRTGASRELVDWYIANKCDVGDARQNIGNHIRVITQRAFIETDDVRIVNRIDWGKR